MRKASLGLFFLFCFPGFVAAAQPAPPDFPKFKRLGVVIDYKNLKYNPKNDVIFPSVIKAKEYFKKPLGAYYMYYAPHSAPGGICLAYADALEGPWHEYGHNPLISRVWKPHYKVGHVSSPHALWIEEEQQLFLWFHGDNHVTRYASSTDGIHFHYEGVAVSSKDFKDISECSYARVFRHHITGLDNRYIIMLMGNNKGTRRIYLGWSKDARHWKTRREPFISAPPDSSSGQAVSPWLFPWRGNLYVIYHSRFKFPQFGEMRSVMAAEVDPRFRETRPAVHFFTAIPGEPENGRVSSPCFIQEGNKLYMFYESGKRLNAKIAAAVADVPPQSDTQ